ncbi:MAG: fused MFS/spermidine synthase [Acidobacteriia bacterium]|nr:fused MFS/spermidine synthase [Terriglobia bacterium]
MPTEATSSNRAAGLLYAAVIFLGAFLLFLIEPLLAKVILPWFGGSASVWATCLVFFQSTLLLGYAYADFTTRRFSPRQLSSFHVILLLASLALLPITPGAHWRPAPGGDPAWRILALLATSIGLPFLLLSVTSPLVQSWYARRRPGAQPYHLFALSNLASFLALLSYPFLIEPRTATDAQLHGWSWLYLAFVAFCAAAAWISRSAAVPEPSPAAGAAEADAPPELRTRLLWLALSACGSMLLLSVTNHLTQNVAPIPLLWVLPLALYLLTFAMAFNRRSLYSHWLMVRLLAVMLGALGYAIYEPSFAEKLQVSVPLFGAGLFVCCLFCHGELYRLRPAASQLTRYYLTISLGGALGAIFVGLVAPYIFRNVYEFPLTLLVTALFALFALWREGWLARIFWSAAAVAMAVVLVLNIRARREDSIVMVRNFYAALRVTETKDDGRVIRTLLHGTIDHGEEFMDPAKHLLPISYYGPDSGVALALNKCCEGPKKFGVIGLGTGTLAAFGKAGDTVRYYEINPQVVAIARNSFYFLRETPAKVELVLGDARLSLEREEPQQFDVLAVDAFSGDAIPVHLLTREAVALYFRHLKPDGILAIHTSNTYLDLAPIVKQIADQAGVFATLISNDDDDENMISTSDWVLLTKNKSFAALPEIADAAEPIVVPPKLRLWTDSYNNLFYILKPIVWRKKAEDEQ